MLHYTTLHYTTTKNYLTNLNKNRYKSINKCTGILENEIWITATIVFID